MLKITDSDIKKICSENIYKSGCDYFKEGRVHIRVRSEKSIVASVDSDKIYNVHIGFDKNGKISETFCTCPYYQTMSVSCKHIVATLKTRQAEILSDGDFEDSNDKLASRLCSDFEKQNRKKEHMNIGFGFNINTNARRECSYSVSIKLGNSEINTGSVENFLKAYITGEEYKLSKHRAYNNSIYEFNGASKDILDILAEALENKQKATAFYAPKLTFCEFGDSTAKRLLPLMEKANCTFFLNGMPQTNLAIKHEDPDILVDVTATDDNINISVIQSGLSVVSDGSWFLYDGDLYETSKEWQNWYMPIYNALSTESRTQIDFKGDNSISFAANVLPKIKNQKGVITQGIDDVIVDSKPDFNVYLDETDGGILAAVTVNYGQITLRLPEKNEEQGKIIVRDYVSESHILSFFGHFNIEGQNMYLMENDEIYAFLTRDIKELQKIAKIHTSQRFDALLMQNAPKIKNKIFYNSKIDLLEVGFETDISPSEIAGILSAVRNKKKYYRMTSGAFLDLESGLPDFELLESLDFSFSDLKERRKELSKNYALFLAGTRDRTEANADFDKLIDDIRKTRANIPDYLDKVLRDYQKTGVHWLKQLSSLGFGGILADDMGLGKTLEIIAFVMSEKSDLPTLVVTPSSLMYNWLSEINKFTPKATAKVIDGTKEERTKSLLDTDGYDFIITSYPLLRRDISEYENKEFFCFVIDEAQHIKNPKTLSAKAVKRIKAKSCFALSGTPIENSLSELWSIFDFVMPKYLGQRTQFAESFEKPIMHGGDDEAADNLRRKIKPFVMRRMKYEVLSELPERIENTVLAEPTPTQKKMYASYLAISKKEVNEIVKYGGDNLRILSILMRLRQICCHPALLDGDYDKESGKLMLFEDIVTSGIDSGHRILVFSQFTSMLSIIKNRLDALGISYFYLDGSTNPHMRKDMTDRFNSGEKSVFLISLKAGGTGLNLVGADMVIHYDPWWNPAAVDQASDRAYRIGQTRAVHIIKLATRGTIEEQILKLQEKKRNLADDMIRTNSATLSNLTKEELLEFFK
ncbi:MAG: DEAD/DEAH box helicase [Clostridia bacterium]|nr:DEAD/DEAH box helicase [Clostridia bacterium]